MDGGFSWSIAFLVFTAYCVLDWMFTVYTLSIVNKRPFLAANVGTALYGLAAFGVINYVEDWRYVIPMCIGGWIGTYLSVLWERKKHDK
jgi:uncharacterized membrane protein YfcA